MIKDLGELRKLMTLCRSKGVTEISFDGVAIKFGDAPPRGSKDEAEDDQTADPTIDPLTGLTPEQLANWSVQTMVEQQ